MNTLDNNFKVCLSIAGSDCGGEAGIQADKQAFEFFGHFACTAITAVTAQNPNDFKALNAVSPKVLSDQLLSLKEHFSLGYVKTGILPTKEHMEVVLEALGKESYLVTDPLLISTSGRELMDKAAQSFFKEEFLYRVNCLTPNIPELEFLTGQIFEDEESMVREATKFAEKYRLSLYLKGGHSEEKPSEDYFFDGGQAWALSAKKLDIRSSHGTGCRLSSAFLASFASEKTLLDSAIQAKAYVYESLGQCKAYGGLYLMSSISHCDNNQITVREL